MTLTLHSKTYSKDQLPSLIAEKYASKLAEWEMAFFQFLSHWMDESEIIRAETSGSTGVPKTILLSKKNMIASAKLTNQYFGLKEDADVLLCLSADYIAGKMMIVRAIIGNLHLVVSEPCSCPIIDRPMAFAAMVPMQVEAMLNSEGGSQSLNLLSTLLIGGSAPSEELERRLLGISTSCFASYGMTETVSHIALRALNGPDKSMGYEALAGVWFEQDERECLVIHAPHLQDIPFITNDIVRLKNNNRFEWVGRFDHVINSGGIKLFPELLEGKIAPFIQQRFYIIGKKDEKLGEMAVLVIEGRLGTEHLEGLLRSVLTPYEIPREIIFMPTFEETSTGKIIRRLP